MPPPELDSTALQPPSAPARQVPERPQRPQLPRRARTTRTTGNDTWTVDTRRGYSHYNQNASVYHHHHPHPTQLGSAHLHAQARTHSLYNPAFLQTPYSPVIGALPAIAAGVQSIRKWHTRSAHLEPQNQSLGDAHLALRRYQLQPSAARSQAASPARQALAALLEQHAERLALQRAAGGRAITEGSYKTASAFCELFTFMLVPLPAIHTFFGVEAGTMLMRPYTTFIIPAAFLVTAGLQIAYYVERFQDSFALWQQSRQAALGATGTQPYALQLPALGDACLPHALMRECIYTACQLFFWSAFACGMSAASGSMFVGLISPPVAIVCLLIGVAGTTAMHMGWANAYGTPDRVDDATNGDFGSLMQRRRSYAALREEAQHIQTFRLTCGAQLPGAKAFIYQSIVPLLERVPQASVVTHWLLNRWFAPVSERLGPVVVAHLQRLCQGRLTHQQAIVKATAPALAILASDEGQQRLAHLPIGVRTLAQNAQQQQQQQHDEALAAQSNVQQLLEALQAPDAPRRWQAVARQWLFEEHEDVTEQQVAHKLYQWLINEPLLDIETEIHFLKWTQRVSLHLGEPNVENVQT